MTRFLKAALMSILLFVGPPAPAGAPKAWGYIGWWLPQSWRSMPLGQLDRVIMRLHECSTAGLDIEQDAVGAGSNLLAHDG